MASSLFSPAAARIAGNVATIAFAGAILLQILLALGVIPVTMAWGGGQPTLTLALRLASIVAAMILALCAWVVRRRAGLSGSAPPSRPIRILSWIITVYMAVNTLGNLASTNAEEAVIFGTISLLLVISCAVVSASRPA